MTKLQVNINEKPKIEFGFISTSKTQLFHDSEQARLLKFKNAFSSLSPLHNKHSYNFKHFFPKLSKQHSVFPNKPLNIKQEQIDSNFNHASPEINKFTQHIPYIKNKQITIFNKQQITTSTNIPTINKIKSLSPLKLPKKHLYKITLSKHNIFSNNNNLNIISTDSSPQTLIQNNQIKQKLLQNKKLFQSNSCSTCISPTNNNILHKKNNSIDSAVQIKANSNMRSKSTGSTLFNLINKIKMDKDIPLSFPLCTTYDINFI